MALESPVTYVDDLVITNPTGTDARSEGDDHIRNVKKALQNCLPDMGHQIGAKDAAGAANAYTLTFTSSAPTSYIKYASYTFIASTSNTTSTTLEVNGLGAKSIKKGADELDAGDIAANRPVQVVYDGTDFQLANPPSRYIRRNLLFNGAMQVWQRDTGPVTNSGGVLAADRWYLDCDSSSGITWSRVTDTPDDSVQYALEAQVNATYAGSDAQAQILQRLETQDIKNSGWKYTDPSSYLTLTFWAKSSLAGTFGGHVRANEGGTTARTFSFTFTLAADTWTEIEVRIPGDSGLTLDAGDADIGFEVRVVMHLGADFTTPGHNTGQWQNVNGSDILPDFPQNWRSGSNTFYLTKVKLEVGEVATPFQALTYAEELARCERYYQAFSNVVYQGYVVNGVTAAFNLLYRTAMRDVPTITFGTTTVNFFPAGDPLTTSTNNRSTRIYKTPVSTGAGNFLTSVFLDAEL